MAIVVSSMDLAERPRNQRPTDPPTTTQKPETTTEDTSNRILSLPNEEKCMKSKFLTFCVLKSVHFKKTVAQSSFLSKVFIIFADFVLITVKMTTLLKEMRIVQLSS